MRPWALPIVGAVAFSLALPSDAEARLRSGPGVVLGAFAGAMFGGVRYAGRNHQRRAVRPYRRPDAAAGGERAATPNQAAASAPGYVCRSRSRAHGSSVLARR